MADGEFSKIFHPSIARKRWPLTFERRGQTHIGSMGTSAFHRDPSPRDVLQSGLERIYGDSPEARNRIHQMMERAEFFFGTPFGAYDTTRAISEGRYKDAAVPAISTVAPWAGKFIKPAARAFPNTHLGDEAGDLSEASTIATSAQNLEGVPRGQIDDAVVKPDIFSRPDTPPKQTGLAVGDASGGHAKIATSNLEALPSPSTLRRPPIVQAKSLPHLSPPASYVRPAAPPEEAIRRSANGDLTDWENLVFEPPVPGGLWLPRSRPWIVQKGPLAKPRREFVLDYPGEAEANEAGDLLWDISGNPLRAKHIAGRRKKGQRDLGLTPAIMRSIIEDDFKIPILRVPKNQLSGDNLGEVSFHLGKPYVVRIWDRLPDDQVNVVLAHEFGHIIHALTGWKRPSGLTPELNKIYSEAQTGQLRPPEPVTPKSLGYEAHDWIDEKMAEAIRTAGVDPNTIKTIGPKTAAFLREIINTHPIVSKIFQVNNIPFGIPAGAAGTALLGIAGQTNQSRAADMPSRRVLPNEGAGDDKLSPGPSVSPVLTSETVNAGTSGLAMLAKALSQRDAYSKTKGNKMLKDIVRALIGLDTKQEPHLHGGRR